MRNRLRIRDQMAVLFPVQQLANHRLDSFRVDLLDDFQRPAASFVTALVQCRYHIVVTMMLGDGSQVEHVAWLQVPASEVDLLRCNLGWGFEVDHLPSYLVAPAGRIKDGRRTYEVDLAQCVIGQFERLRSVALIFVGKTGQREILGYGIEKRHNLRIIEKDIDIVAFTMVDLEHERRTAAEAP